MIENHTALRRQLEAEGFTFRSQTDTEVIAHLIARELDGTDDLFVAVRRVLPRLEGTYGLAVVSPRRPGQVVGVRLGSPSPTTPNPFSRLSPVRSLGPQPAGAWIGEDAGRWSRLPARGPGRAAAPVRSNPDVSESPRQIGCSPC